MKAYHIIQWDTAHETAESRKYQRLHWTATPNKHDGVGYRQITRSKHRDSLYAAWKLICEVSSKNPRSTRGWLFRDGRPLTADDLSLITGFSKKSFELAMEFFCQPEVGWLELAEFTGNPEAPTGTPGESSGTHLADKRREEKNRPDSDKENNGGYATKEEARKAQAQQFGATQARITELEAIPEDERKPATDAESKKTGGG